MQPGWVGRRVSVRRAVGRAPDGRPRFADVVGELLTLDDAHAAIATRGDRVEVDLRHVTAARLVAPSTADELALEDVAARGWRAAETTTLGGWTLRASGGFTSRANSVLPRRAAGRPLDSALDLAGAWYAERGLPLRLQVPIEARRLLDAELGERGYVASPPVQVLITRLGAPPPSLDDQPSVTLAAEPSADWLHVFRAGTVAAEPAARGVLTRHDTVTFASIRVAEAVVAVGRGVVDDDWLGLSALDVTPAYRGQGLGARLVGALHEWGRAHQASRSYLQVTADNTAALRSYDRLGYWLHHEYHYRTEPTA